MHPYEVITSNCSVIPKESEMPWRVLGSESERAKCVSKWTLYTWSVKAST